MMRSLANLAMTAWEAAYWIIIHAAERLRRGTNEKDDDA
jgi:hypothetical protein